ncbi:MAG: hypothetical protein M2R45_02324 [Verrucomicrobia subdivision 3 bacterium]|nr:hypothetical protein [Limisphaerales bacterium]MCS1414703.1 hypothetical protein [Limisphaerales bacterium]
MFPHASSVDQVKWQPGPYEGVDLKVLHKNQTTKGVTVLRRFQLGATIPAHVHHEANETAYILSGEWEESGELYSEGTCFFAPKGIRHGPHHARTEVISLTIFDGPLTVD